MGSAGGSGNWRIPRCAGFYVAIEDGNFKIKTVSPGFDLTDTEP